MKRSIFLLSCICCLHSGYAQKTEITSLPLTVLPAKIADTGRAMILYISGDGGENEFSNNFIKQLNDQGYPVVLFNTLKYFWSKKDPKVAADDIENVIAFYKNHWKKNKLILMGYSMGADVVPFIYTRLSADKQAAVKNIVLISPSGTTDFQVHVTTLFASKKNFVSVADEINRITKPVLIVQGDKESDKLETAKLKNRNFSVLVLKGGHHYNSATDVVVSSILQNLSK